MFRRNKWWDYHPAAASDHASENVMHACLPSIYLISYSISSIGEARIPQFYQKSIKQEHDRQERSRTLDSEESRTLESGFTEHWTMPGRGTLYQAGAHRQARASYTQLQESQFGSVTQHN